MSDPIRRLPILLQGVDTNLAGSRHIRMEDLGGKPTWYNYELLESYIEHQDVHFGGAAGNSLEKLNLTLK